MTDLPTRLRTDAEKHDRLGRKLWLCGIPDGAEMRERAGLMRDAADEIERLREAIKTEANDTREMADSVKSLEAKACLEAVADNLDAARWASPASSLIVKTGKESAPL